MIKLGDKEYFEIESGGTPSTQEETYWNGHINWATLVDLPATDSITTITETKRKITDEGLKNSSAKLLPENSVLISSRATIGRIAINKVQLATNQGFKNIIIKDFNKVNPLFVAKMTTQLVEKMELMATGGTFKEISKSAISTLEIPLPPLEVQEELVKELDAYQQVIDGAKKVVENWKPSFTMNPSWKKVKLDDICDVQSGGTPPRSEHKYWDNGTINWYSSGELNDVYTIDSKEKTTIEGLNNSNAKIFPKGSLLIGMYDTAAFKMSILNCDGAFNQAISAVRPNEKIDMYFLYLYFSFKKDEYLGHRAGARQQNLNKGYISSLEIPLPPMEEQKEIVAKIEIEEKAIEQCKTLIKIHEQKIANKIKSIWGEDNAE
jgi:type I restriction enzyme M protein